MLPFSSEGIDMPFMIAQAGLAPSIVHYVIVAIIIAGVIGIGFIVARQAGIVVPAFIVQILWIIAAVVIGVMAISFIAQYL